MAFLRRLNRWAVALVTAPLRISARLTQDGWLFFALAVLSGLLSIGANAWSNIPLLMCLVLLSLWLTALWHGSRAIRDISFRRSHVERTFANEPVSVMLHVTNRSRLPVAGLVITERVETERAPRGGESGKPAEPSRPAQVVAQGAAFVSVVPGRGEDHVRYSLTVRRRGLYRFGETALESVFPLGFFHTGSLRNAPGRLVVYPRMGEVDSTFLEELELALRHVRCSRPSRSEEDFRGLREYRQGDNPRWIHWRSSARNEELLVKEFEEPQAKRVLLLLDTNLQRLGTQRFALNEQAISFAATLARDLARRGYEIDCVALQPVNRMVRVVVSRERRNLDALLEMLAGLRRDDTRTLASLVDCLGRRRLHHVYVLVLGLGSLRAKPALGWLRTMDNVVRVFDARGEEFRRIYRPSGSGTARDQFSDEDLLLGIGEEDAPEEDVAVPARAAT